MEFDASDLSRLTPGAADLSGKLRLLCYCGRQLDRVGYWDQGRMVMPVNAARRPGAPSRDGYKWTWRCRRCMATPQLAQPTLDSKYEAKAATGDPIVFGLDV